MNDTNNDYREAQRRKRKVRTIRNVTALVILALVLVGLYVVRWQTVIAPQNEINDMAYIEVAAQSGETFCVEVAPDNCRYDTEAVLMKNPVGADLVMKNGDRQPISYDEHYGVFRMTKYAGCYHLENK